MRGWDLVGAAVKVEYGFLVWEWWKIFLFVGLGGVRGEHGAALLGKRISGGLVD
ncbi:MAG: hypothetical protein JWN40_4565 [Phycisphaerales bacterium]|nr:hypothetical protein [Phycisphaerales bacterium]